ncbi:MAG TPA: transglutaminase family protein [Crenalkalicoccus sp.]|jgi:transglutaminase-like putative cysteine protease|nr:transglutaminase family protein [Crenalkalicoccus sp.]
MFGEAPCGHVRASAVCEWIRGYLECASGISDESTAALDTLALCAGVCRDFAHLAIVLCRALGIPVRHVSGYACRLDPPDFHVLVEVWLHGPVGHGWHFSIRSACRRPTASGIVLGGR